MDKKKKKVRIDITFFAEFEKYSSKKKNLAAERQIRAWVRDTLNNCAGYIPFYVEKGENGAMLEGCTPRTKFKIK
jgi:hypothetical protein